MEMIKGTTKSGFEFEFSKDVLNDMELIDALADVMDDNPLAVSKVIVKILGKDQKKRLYEHLRDESGRVPATAVGEAFADFLTALGENGKNS